MQEQSWTVVTGDDGLDPALLREAGEICRVAFGGTFDEHDWAHTFGGRRWVAVDGSRVLGHAAVVPRTLRIGDRGVDAGYVEGVAVVPSMQRRGIGGALMRGVDEAVREQYDVGVLSTSRHAFYERLGWERWRGPTYVDHGSRLERTPDEDAGIMVLRTPFGPDLDLTASITCDARDGDDW